MHVTKFILVVFGLLFIPFGQQFSEAVEPFSTIETSAGKLAFSTDGKLLAIGGDFNKQLKLWKVGSNEPAKILETDNGLYQSVAFSPDGKLLSATRVSLDRSTPIASVYDSRGDKRLFEYTSGSFWAVFTPDSKSLVVGSVGFVTILDARTGKKLNSFSAQKQANVSAGAFSADGKVFVTSGGEEKQLKTWNPKTFKVLKTIPIEGNCETLAVGPNGKLMACAFDHTIAVISSESGKTIWSNATAHTEKVRCVAISPDGKELVTAGDDRTVRRWNLSDGKEIATIESQRGVCEAVCYSPDGQSLAVGTPIFAMIYRLAAEDDAKPATNRE